MTQGLSKHEETLTEIMAYFDSGVTHTSPGDIQVLTNVIRDRVKYFLTNPVVRDIALHVVDSYPVLNECRLRAQEFTTNKDPVWDLLAEGSKYLLSRTVSRIRGFFQLAIFINSSRTDEASLAASCDSLSKLQKMTEQDIAATHLKLSSALDGILRSRPVGEIRENPQM